MKWGERNPLLQIYLIILIGKYLIWRKDYNSAQFDVNHQ